MAIVAWRGPRPPAPCAASLQAAACPVGASGRAPTVRRGGRAPRRPRVPARAGAAAAVDLGVRAPGSASARPPTAVLRGAYDVIALDAAGRRPAIWSRGCSELRRRPSRRRTARAHRRARARRPRRAVAQVARVGADVDAGAAHRRDRHRQGGHGAADPRAGRRAAAKPFVPINCAAIPNELMEAELFGYARGAFSGAVPALRRPAAGGRGRHGVPRRDRRHAARRRR